MQTGSTTPLYCTHVLLRETKRYFLSGIKERMVSKVSTCTLCEVMNHYFSSDIKFTLSLCLKSFHPIFQAVIVIFYITERNAHIHYVIMAMRPICLATTGKVRTQKTMFSMKANAGILLYKQYYRDINAPKYAKRLYR